MSKDIRPFNDKGEPHGYWEVYYRNGKLWHKSFLQNCKEVGYEELYDCNNGDLHTKTYYL
jgi:antitoxin component YwqK of YwqJK toxin-antitoxin module